MSIYSAQMFKKKSKMKINAVTFKDKVLFYT